MAAPSRKVALVVGGSRGMGRQIAIDLAKNGYAVVVAAKTTSKFIDNHAFPPDPNSPQSTIDTVAREIIEAGGEATAITVDTRKPASIQALLSQTFEIHRRLDALVYNSGAIWWASVERTPLSRFQLMQRVNVEGLYATVQAALPYFAAQDWKARVVVVSPPIYSRFFRGKTAYAMGKVGMSVLTKGLAMDWAREGKTGMAITSLWPAVAIQSAATKMVDKDGEHDLRKPTIFSDAVMAVLNAPVGDVNGELELDEDFLRKRGVVDFAKYSVVPGSTPRRIMPAKLPDLTVEEQNDEGKRVDSSKMRARL